MQWLRKVEAKKLPLIFKNSLEPDLFTKLLKTIESGFIAEGDLLEAGRMLAAISSISRFSMLLMLLDKNDIKLVTEVFDKLTEACAASPEAAIGEDLNMMEVNQLRKVYLGK